MIAELLPDSVASATLSGDEPGSDLFPEEMARIARAVTSRRQEFATARLCARRALALLGVPPCAIPSGQHREPLWPPGLVGSITHCTGYRAAAVARATDIQAIGIDAELHEALPAGVLARVSVPEERSALPSAPNGVHWDRLLFSAKESIYKSWFPLARRPLAFADATVIFEPETGRFRARLRDAPSTLEGRFLVHGRLALTAVVIAR
jgi:4'-phosphopantetheinyl transferase EntD